MSSKIISGFTLWASVQIFLLPAYADVVPTPCPNGQCPGMGQGFVLSNINLMDAAQQTSGQRIFLNTSIGTCATVSPVGNSGKNIRDYSNKTEIIAEWSSGVDTDKSKNGVGLNYAGFTLGISANATFKTDFNEATTIVATSLDQFNLSQTVDLNRNTTDCWSVSNLSPPFLAAFESLAEIDTTTVSEDSSWQPYRDFLNNWGSHIQIKQEQGSRVQLWESSNGMTAVTTSELQAKLCFDLGLQAAGAVGACSNYNMSQRNAASLLDINKTIYILGGDDASRTALINGYSASSVLDPTLLANFMAAGNTSVAPIRFGYLPIWSLLTQIYQPLCNASTKGQTPCKNYQRAIALQAAYQGYMAYNCHKSADSTNNPFQKMIALPANSLGISSYACHQSKSGCRRDKDCHYGGDLFSVWTWGGYCYGSGCIAAKLIPGTANPPLYRATQKIADTSGDPDMGTNASCSNDWVPGCNTDWEGGALERDIWNQAVDGPGSGNVVDGRLTTSISRILDPTGSSSSLSGDMDVSNIYTLKLIVKREKPKSRPRLKEEVRLSKQRSDQEEYLVVEDSSKALNCPGTCIASFTVGQKVELSVSVPPNYRFLKWGGDYCNERRISGKRCTVTMNSNKVIEAFYE